MRSAYARVARVDAVGQRLDEESRPVCERTKAGRVRRVVERPLRELRDLRQRRVRDRDRRRLAVAAELHRADDERVRAAGGEADHERALVDPAEPRERLLRGRGRDLGTHVEQHQQVAQVGGEEGHLVGAGDQDPLGVAIASIAASTSERETLRAVSSTFTWSAATAGSNGFRSSENSGAARSAPSRGGGDGRAGTPRARPPGARGSPRSRAPGAKRTTVERRCVRAARELLGRVEGDLVEMIDDVLGDVLLRARELVEA